MCTEHHDAGCTRAHDFNELTVRGQLAYADFIADGYTHEQALRDAQFSYGKAS